jgi:ACS family hexuronate transporter-like MFS transporter
MPWVIFIWKICRQGSALKSVFAIAVFSWSIAAMGHAFVKSLFGFNVVRGTLGFFEGGNFPAAIKAIANGFLLKKDRWRAGS